METILKNT